MDYLLGSYYYCEYLLNVWYMNTRYLVNDFNPLQFTCSTRMMIMTFTKHVFIYKIISNACKQIPCPCHVM